MQKNEPKAQYAARGREREKERGESAQEDLREKEARATRFGKRTGRTETTPMTW